MRTIALILVMVMLLAFTACGEGEITSVTETQVASTQQSNETMASSQPSSEAELTASVDSTVSKAPATSVASKAATASKATTSKTKTETKKLVSDAVYETVKDPYDGTVYEYHIPQINLSGNMAAKANQQMRADGMAWLNKAKGDGKGINLDYRYSWWNANGIISVLATGQYPTGDSLAYYVYNVAADSGKILTNNDLRQKYQLSQQQLTNLITEKAGACFKNTYQGISVDSFYTEQYNKTVAASNVNQSTLFINNAGDLCCVTNIYSLAGADSYYRVLNLTGTTKTDFPR